MKKYPFLFLLIAFSYTHAFAQDLIVTNDGDSVNCRITKVEQGNIYFTFKTDDDQRNAMTPISNIKKYKYDFFKNSEVPEEKIVGDTDPDYNTFSIGLGGGFSYQIGKVSEEVPSDFEDYVEELKAGFHYGGHLVYYFLENRGIGLNAYLFKTSNSLESIYVEDSQGNKRHGRMSHDLTISFIGPKYSYRVINRDKTGAFLMETSIGYMGYSCDIVMVDDYKMTGNTVGASFKMGYDIGFSESPSLNIYVKYISGVLNEYTWDDGVSEQTKSIELGESLRRFDFSVGLNF